MTLKEKTFSTSIKVDTFTKIIRSQILSAFPVNYQLSNYYSLPFSMYFEIHHEVQRLQHVV